MLLTTALLAIYSAYAFLIGGTEDSNALIASGVVSIVAMCGVASMKPWSRWLVCALTFGFLSRLGISLDQGYASGFFGFQFGNPQEIALLLVPESSIAVLSDVCCWLVRRDF